MAKIKINRLPDGFEFKDGKIVEKKQSGGMLTGDQSNYGLVTTNPSMDVSNGENRDVRYSLSRVPRDEANVEAEGGETVLADLNGDGSFGLYDIVGPRHASGGVPLYLPEQSFVYSDFNKLKFDKSESAELGVETRKKMTPAKLSKKFPLNQFYGAMDDPYADKIQVESAQAMMDKNKMKLSQLAFMQEAKKEFEDGVPYSSYPYLVKNGVDPIEFTQKVEQISREKAQQKLIQSLPMEQQMQIAALQQYMQQVDNQQQMVEDDNIPEEQMSEEPMPQQMMPPEQMQQQMQYGGMRRDNTYVDNLSLEEIQDIVDYNTLPVGPMTPEGRFKKFLQRRFYKDFQDIYNSKLDLETLRQMQLRDKENRDRAEKEFDRYGLERLPEMQMGDEYMGYDEPLPLMQKAGESGPAYSDRYKKVIDDIIYRIQDEPPIQERPAAGSQPRVGTTYDRAMQNLPIFKENWSQIYPGYEDLIKAIETGSKGELEEVGKFQNWFNNVYLKDKAIDLLQYAMTDLDQYVTKDKLKDKFFEPEVDYYLKQLQNRFGFVEGMDSREFDKKFGDFTSSLRAFSVPKIEEPVITGDPEDGEDTDVTDEVEETQETDETDETQEFDIDDPTLETPRSKRIPPEFFLQDKIKLDALQRRQRDMFLPYQPPVEDVNFGYVLEDPTRAIAALNEQYNIGAQAMGAFSGPQAMSSRLSGLSGKAAEQVANTIAGVNQRNVNTINKGEQLGARFEMLLDEAERNRKTQLYDDTQLVLQNYMNEKNYDREQFADAYANAITNAVQANYLNQLQDYYNIRPSTGGLIEFINPAAFQKADYKSLKDTLTEIKELGVDLEAIYPDGLPNYVKKYLFEQNLNPQTRGQREMSMYDPFNYFRFDNSVTDQNKSKKGKEIKRYAVPFYAGKTGI